MTIDIDRRRVQGSFHRQAEDYDDHAVVQARVVENILALLQQEGLDPCRVLDIGAGTGRLLASLGGFYPQALAVGADLALGMCRTASERLGQGVVVNADAERLPFVDGSFDLVLSTSTFQWLTSLDRTFSEVKRVLAAGGCFCFALFGERTLFELRESYRTVLDGAEDRTHSFFTSMQVRKALEESGFGSVMVTCELEVELHPDVPELLRSLKRIGAGNAVPGRPKGLSQRRMMLDMMELYADRYGRENGDIPATYEVIYGIGKKR